jgi:hypothetical protein
LSTGPAAYQYRLRRVRSETANLDSLRCGYVGVALVATKRRYQ